MYWTVRCMDRCIHELQTVKNGSFLAYPVHYNFDEPQRYGNKHSVIFSSLIKSLVVINQKHFDNKYNTTAVDSIRIMFYCFYCCHQPLSNNIGSDNFTFICCRETNSESEAVPQSSHTSRLKKSSTESQACVTMWHLVTHQPVLLHWYYVTPFCQHVFDAWLICVVIQLLHPPSLKLSTFVFNLTSTTVEIFLQLFCTICLRDVAAQMPQQQ